MGKVVEAIIDIPATIVEVTGKVVEKAGDIVGDVGDITGLSVLSSVGNAIEDAGGDLAQVGKVLKGDYHDDLKKIQDMESAISNETAKYNKGVDELVDKMEGLIAFHEIFQMAAQNRLDEYSATYNVKLDGLIAEYKAAVAKLKSEYDFVIGLTEGSFLEKIVGSILMIIGGIMSDMGDILNGKADSTTWKRMVTNVVMVLAIVALFFIPGLQGVALYVAVALASISAFMTFDGMYANGAATGAIMGVLDTVFNDVLNLDDIIGSDFNKFDKNNEDYAQMVMFTQLAMALGSMAAAWSGMASAGSTTVTEMVSTENGFVMAGSAEGQVALGATPTTTTSYLGGAVKIGGTAAESSVFGVSFSTYSGIYKAYSTATSINDVVGANDQYENMKEKFASDIEKLNEATFSKISKSFMGSYKDVAYFLQDQQEFIDRYVWSMTAQNMYVDPYGTTPVANIRFTPDKDTRMMSFGYEDVLDESKLAGSKSYFNNILYG